MKRIKLSDLQTLARLIKGRLSVNQRSVLSNFISGIPQGTDTVDLSSLPASLQKIVVAEGAKQNMILEETTAESSTVVTEADPSGSTVVQTEAIATDSEGNTVAETGAALVPSTGEPQTTYMQQASQESIERQAAFENSMVDADSAGVGGNRVELFRTEADGREVANLDNLMRVAYSDEFSEWRNNPDNAESLRSVRAALTRTGINQILNLGVDANRIIQISNQLREANRLRDQGAPQRPRPIDPNINLVNAIAEAQRALVQGLTPEERALAQRQRDREAAATRNAIIEASGGQSGQATAALSRLEESLREERLAERVAAQTAQRQTRGQLAQLVGTQVQEGLTRQGQEQDIFLNYDAPLYSYRLGRENELRDAARNNLYAFGDSLATRLQTLANMFGGELPGFVPSDQYYQNQESVIESYGDRSQSNEDTALMEVMNSPARYMSIGTAGDSYFSDPIGMHELSSLEQLIQQPSNIPVDLRMRNDLPLDLSTQ